MKLQRPLILLPVSMQCWAAMRIATWNVNSIRARIDRVTDWLGRNDVDVLAIQETKCREDQFPYSELEAIGYQAEVLGLNQWNGVALISREPLTDVQHHFAGVPQFGGVKEPRAIAATVSGVRVYSLYVPHGRAVGDEHYAYKLDWLEKLAEEAAALADTPVALTGDFNVAPLDSDVWDRELFEGATHVSPPERAAFSRFLEAGYRDVVRELVPDGFTYWDYQRLRFPRNEGMRIDFILASEPLARLVTGASIDRDERKGRGASDHVPVLIDIDAARVHSK